MEIGDIVISLKGHDKSEPFVVVAQVNADFVLIADGKHRTLENPKLKRKRHLRVACSAKTEPDPTNATLVKRIKQFISERRLYAEE